MVNSSDFCTTSIINACIYLTGLGYAMVPLLADYVLCWYGWRHVCALFSVFCCLSTVFGCFLEPPNCCCHAKSSSGGEAYETKIVDMDNTTPMQDVEEEKLLVNDDVHITFHNTKKQENIQTQIIKHQNAEKIVATRTMSDTCNVQHLRKNKSESYLKIEDDFEVPHQNELRKFRFSVVSCIDILFGLEGNELMLIKEAKPLEKKRLSVLSKEIESYKRRNALVPEAMLIVSSYLKTSFEKSNDTNEISSVSENNEKDVSNEQHNNGHMNRILRRRVSTFLKIFKFPLFMDTNFVLFCLSNVMLFMALNIPFSYGPDMMVQRKIVSSDKGSNFNMAIGFTSMISMPLVGILVDNGPKLDPFMVTFFSMISAGVSMFIFTLTWSLSESLVVAVWFGVSFSAFLSLPPVILEIILGKENVASAYGLLVFIRGVSITVGPPVAGFIYDITNTYDGSFFFAGVLFVMAGLPIFTAYVVRKRR